MRLSPPHQKGGGSTESSFNKIISKKTVIVNRMEVAMSDKKIGNQLPTQSVTLPYEKSLGDEAVKIYSKTGRTAQEWQELILYDMMARNEEDLWTHTKFGYSVPRRNGKNEVVIMRELWGLTNGERILHTAHRTSTSHSAWERIYKLLVKAGYIEREDFKTLKQQGLESIEMLINEGVLNFRTRSSKGGLGEGYDLLVIDEAQEYQDDEESALKYVVSDSKNPQTIFCGTPPTPVSSGTVFTKFRKAVLSGETKNSAWEEWSVEKPSDVHDKKLWYLCNPSLGTVLTERSIEDEIGPDETDFNIQRLGLWIKYNQKSAITKAEWEKLIIPKLPKFNKSLFAGIKYGKDGTNVAMSVAVKTQEGKIFIEGIDCQPVRNGTAWIVDYLRKMQPKAIVIDGANGQQILADELKDCRVKGVILPTVKEIITANASFEQGVFSETICHANQPSMTQAASNCEKRSIGSNGGFGYKTLKDGIEIALLDSAILAFWACNESKVRKKQKVYY